MVMNEPNRPGANPPGKRPEQRPEQRKGEACETGLPAARFSVEAEHETIEPAGGQMQDTREQVKQTAQRVREQVRRQGADLVGRAQSQAVSMIEQGKEAAAGRIDTIAEALRCAADKLRDDQQQTAAQYARTAADQVERLTGYLHNARPNDMLDDVQRFARRRPEIFIGTALAAGFAIGRFLKASGDRNWAERQSRRSRSAEDWEGWEREPVDLEPTAYAGARAGTPGAGFARPMGSAGVSGVFESPGISGSGNIPSYYGSGGNNPAEGGPTSGISAAATTPLNPPGSRFRSNPPSGGGA